MLDQKVLVRWRGITSRKNGYFCFTKKTEERYCDEGYWVSDGEEQVLRPSNSELLGTKTTFRYHLRASNTKTDWYIREYCLDDHFRAKQNIPSHSGEYVLCRLDYEN
ncbi:hypothetical protein EJ110_NYTH05270 [Nymphaea thermarum]|nr:hypothetical protein EJ110_NYTH05270 [Nymphaea thermarum]